MYNTQNPSNQELLEKINALTAQIKPFDQQQMDLRNKIHDLQRQRDELYQQYLKPLVGKTFKRGYQYAIITNVPQPQVTKVSTSLNVQQMPCMVFLYNPNKYLDVTLEVGPLDPCGLMWPDTMFRGEMPAEYNTQGACNTVGRDVWQEIEPSEWVNAYQARCLEVQIRLLKPVTPPR